jgi:hypothetical protein
VTLLLWALGSGALVGWWTAMLWRRGSAPAPAPAPDLMAVMRIDIQGRGITCYLDAEALGHVAALGGFALVELAARPSATRH